MASSRSVSLACSLLLLPGSVASAPAAIDSSATRTPRADRDTVYVLPGLSVEERRALLERELSLRPGFAALYRIDELPSPTATTSDLLAEAVGVHVRQFGGLGSYSAVSVRGSNASQVAFYLDGVPLNQAQYGVVNAADLPLAALERIEVYRGMGPLALANPGAGVVQLVTRAAGGRQLESRVSYGRFDTRQAMSWGTWAGSGARLFGAYQFQSSRGDFVFHDDNGTPLNLEDDERVPRRNNVFQSQGLTLKLDVPVAPRRKEAAARGTGPPMGTLGRAGRLSAALDLFAKHAGMPGISSYQSTVARFATERGVASLTWFSPPWLARSLELSTQAFGLGAHDRLTDLGSELGSGSQDTDDRAWTWGLRQRGALARGPLGHVLEAVAEARREEFRPGIHSPEAWRGPMSRRDALDFGVSQRIEPWRGRLSLEGYARREAAFDDFPAGPAYPVAPSRPAVARTTRFTQRGVGARFRLSERIALRANAGRTHRLPSLFELFGDRGTVLGNRGLLPERQDTRDVGLSWTLPREPRTGDRAGAPKLSAEIDGYRTEAHDLILFIQNSQHASVAQNVSAARLEGLEASLGATWRALRFQANWTAQRARDQSAAPYLHGRRLPGRPDHEGFTRVEYTRARWRAFHEFQYVDGNYLDRPNRDSVPARRIHSLGAGLSLSGGALRVTAEVRNLTGDQVQDAAAYPLPGRTCALSAELRL